MPVMIRTAAAIMLALLIVSCGTARLSRQDRLDFDAGRKAIVRADNSPLWMNVLLAEKPVVRITAVDGVDLDAEVFKLNEQVALDVGTHSIEFSCSDRAAQNEKDFTETIEMELKPYHEYLVDCWFESGFNVEEKRVK